MKIVRNISIALIFVLTLLATGISAQTLIANPECVSYDAARDRFLVSNYTNGQIIEIDSNGVESLFWASPRLAWGSHIDGDTFYVATESSPPAIVAIDLSTDTYIKTTTVYGYTQMDGMTTDSSGNLHVVASANSSVIRLELATDMSYPVAIVSTAPQDLYFDSVLNRLMSP